MSRKIVLRVRSEEVDVDIGGGENDGVELIARAEAAGALPFHQPLHGQKTAHRMRKDIDLSGPGPGEKIGDLGQHVPRDQRAVEIIDITERAGGGGPGEKHGNALVSAVLHELSQAQQCIGGGVVEAVNEEKDRAMLRRARGKLAVDGRDKCRIALEADGIHGREMLARIGRQLPRPLQLPRLMGRGHKNVHGGEAKRACALGGQKCTGGLRRGAGCRDEDTVPGVLGLCCGQALGRGNPDQLGRPGAAGNKDDHHDGDERQEA
jgi:hypothetical protein